MKIYQALCSVSYNHVILICRDGGFHTLPDQVRHQGPWQGLKRGELAKLKTSVGAISSATDMRGCRLSLWRFTQSFAGWDFGTYPNIKFNVTSEEAVPCGKDRYRSE